MARTAQLKKTARDMVLSMAVLVVPLLLIVTFFPHDAKKASDGVQTVDYTLDLSQARRVAPFPVLAPVGLPAGWRATAAHYDSLVYGPDGTDYVPGGVPGAPLRWELGYLTPDLQYVALDEVTDTADKVLAVQVPNAVAVAGDAGKATVGGQVWQKYDGTQRRALVRTAPGTGAGAAQVSIVVSGSGTYAQLEQFAGTLSAG